MFYGLQVFSRDTAPSLGRAYCQKVCPRSTLYVASFTQSGNLSRGWNGPVQIGVDLFAQDRLHEVVKPFDSDPLELID